MESFEVILEPKCLYWLMAIMSMPAEGTRILPSCSIRISSIQTHLRLNEELPPGQFGTAMVIKSGSVAFLLWLYISTEVFGLARSTEVLQDTVQSLKREQGEFERWCNGTLLSQQGRRGALQQLLAQAQSGYESLSQLDSLRKDASAANEVVAMARFSLEANRTKRLQQLMAAQFKNEDASRDVDVLMRAQKVLKGVRVYQGGAGDTIDLILKKANMAMQQTHTQTLLLQSAVRGSDDIDRLESERKSKEDNLGQVELQVYTSQRSLDVLTVSVEDESAYFADLQTICSIGKSVYQRMTTGSLVSLRQALEVLSSRAGDAALTHEANRRKKRERRTLAAALKALPVAPALKTLPTSLPVPHVSAAAAKGIVVMAKPRSAVVSAAVTVTMPAAYVPQIPIGTALLKAESAAGTVTSVKHAATSQPLPTTVQIVAVPPEARDSDSAFALAGDVTPLAQTASPKSEGKREQRDMAPSHLEDSQRDGFASAENVPALHKQRHSSTELHSRRDGVEVANPPRKHNRTLMDQAGKRMKQVAFLVHPTASVEGDALHDTAKTHTREQNHKEHSVTIDADGGQGTSQARQVVMKKQVAPAPDAHMRQGTTDQLQSSQPSPGSDLAADAGTQDMTFKQKKPKAPKGKASFMEEIYSSAAGNMPSQYAAWTPDGGTPASRYRKPKVDMGKSGSATAGMAALLGGEDATDSGDAGTATAAMAASGSKMASPSEAPEGSSSSAMSSEATEASADAEAKRSGMKTDQSQDSSSKALATEQAGLAVVAPDDRSVASAAKIDAGSEDKMDSAKVGAQQSDVQAEEDTTSSPPLPRMHSMSHSDAKADVTDTPVIVASGAAPSVVAKADDSDGTNDIEDDSKEDVSSLELPSSAPLSKHRRPAPAGGDGMSSELSKAFVEGSSVMEHKNLPNQYSAWTPSDAAAVAKKKEAVLAQLEADFDDDGEGATTVAATRAPPKRKHRHHRKASPAPALRKQEEDAGVVYDDDDLPKHHHKPIMAELSGGWQSLMTKKRARKPKLDPEIAAMQSLYTADGSLPSQYTAWSPGTGGDARDAAGPETGESFLQVSSITIDEWSAISAAAAAPDPLGDKAHAQKIDNIIRSVIDAMPVDGRAYRPSAFLEQSIVRADAQRSSAARAVLQEYAEVLQSQALHQLARANPNPAKLKSLWKRLSGVDPLIHPEAMAMHGKQAQAEQWCAFFQKNKPIAPVHQALIALQQARASLINATSQRAAITEEVDARVQLQRTMQQDIHSLMSVLGILKQGTTDSLDLWARNFTKELGTSGAKGLLSLGEAVEGIREGHVELADALEAALRGRSSVLQVQRQKLAALEYAVAIQDKHIVQMGAEVKGAEAKVDSIRNKLENIEKSCQNTLRTFEHRRHSGHMEAHAVEVALNVLGNVV